MGLTSSINRLPKYRVKGSRNRGPPIVCIAEAFPEGKDGVDHFVSVTDFGSWLRNFRVRKELQKVELVKILGVST